MTSILFLQHLKILEEPVKIYRSLEDADLEDKRETEKGPLLQWQLCRSCQMGKPGKPVRKVTAVGRSDTKAEISLKIQKIGSMGCPGTVLCLYFHRE